MEDLDGMFKELALSSQVGLRKERFGGGENLEKIPIERLEEISRFCAPVEALS